MMTMNEKTANLILVLIIILAAIFAMAFLNKYLELSEMESDKCKQLGFERQEYFSDGIRCVKYVELPDGTYNKTYSEGILKNDY